MWQGGQKEVGRVLRPLWGFPPPVTPRPLSPPPRQLPPNMTVPLPPATHPTYLKRHQPPHCKHDPQPHHHQDGQQSHRCIHCTKGARVLTRGRAPSSHGHWSPLHPTEVAEMHGGAQGKHAARCRVPLKPHQHHAPGAPQAHVCEEVGAPVGRRGCCGWAGKGQQQGAGGRGQGGCRYVGPRLGVEQSEAGVGVRRGMRWGERGLGARGQRKDHLGGWWGGGRGRGAEGVVVGHMGAPHSGSCCPAPVLPTPPTHNESPTSLFLCPSHPFLLHPPPTHNESPTSLLPSPTPPPFHAFYPSRTS